MPLRLGQDLTRQGAMKPFIFAHGLRMIGATMADSNTDVQQPHGQLGIGLMAGIAPGTAIVHQHAIRQAIAAKDGAQRLLHRSRLLVGQRLQAEVIARMVIQDRQRLHRAGQRLDGALEIHLPQTIGAPDVQSAAMAAAPTGCPLQSTLPDATGP